MHKKEDLIRAEKLAELGCIACRYLGYGYTPCAIHHIRRHGEKKNHQKTIGLCPKHHQYGGEGVAVHAGREAFTENITSEERLLEMTNLLIKDMK